VTPRLRIKLLRTGLEISNWEEEDTPGAGAPSEEFCQIYSGKNWTQKKLGTLGTKNVNGVSDMSPLRLI
jgi:hypothetical protein